MTNTELIEPYFKSIGFKFISEDENSIEPVAVFILQDYIYQVFNRDIKNIPLKFQAKKIQTDWHKANVQQFTKFFDRLDEERRDRIISLMDDFEVSLHNDIEMMRLKILDCLPVEDEDVQKAVASLQLCNILAQISQMHWEGMVKGSRFLSVKQHYNDAVRRYSCMLSAGLFGGAGGKEINHKAENELLGFIQNFENKFAKWMTEKSC